MLLEKRDKMKINIVVVGILETNCYILEKNNEYLIIDPGDDFNKIINNLDNQKKVIGILLTHSHFDHVGAVDDLVNKYHCPLYNYASLKEGNNTIGNFSFELIHTPGHISDAISFYFKEDKIMFVGDFIFNGSIGRMDMEGGNTKDMKSSIRKILEYPHDITLYPGHGPNTTLKDEINNLNYYLDLL